MAIKFPLAAGAAALLFAGCGDSTTTATPSPFASTSKAAESTPKTAENTPKAGEKASDSSEADEIAANRAKLSPEDRALADAQQWCAVKNNSLLGSMGVPLKLTLKGKPVFLCCSGCKKKAEADPDKTLAKVEELKEKAKAAKAAKG